MLDRIRTALAGARWRLPEDAKTPEEICAWLDSASAKETLGLPKGTPIEVAGHTFILTEFVTIPARLEERNNHHTQSIDTA